MCARRVSFLGVFLAASSLAAAEPTFEGTTVSQWVAQLQSPDIKERTSAAMALAELGAQAAPAVPALARALEDSAPIVRVVAAGALAQMGPLAAPAASALAGALKDPDPGVRAAAADALRAIGSGAEAAESALKAALSDADPSVRKVAAEALQRVTTADAGKPRATAGLQPPGVGVASPRADGTPGGAAAKLPEGTLSGKPLGELIATLKSADSSLRAEAACSLARLGAKAAPAASQLQAALKDLSPLVRASAAEAIGSLGPEALGPLAKMTIPSLVVSLKDHSPLVRATAARALGRMGSAAGPAAPYIEDSVADGDPEVEMQARRALEQIAGPKGAPEGPGAPPPAPGKKPDSRPATKPTAAPPAGGAAEKAQPPAAPEAPSQGAGARPEERKPAPKAASKEPAQEPETPPEGRVFYLVGYHEVDEEGIRPRKRAVRTSTDRTAYLFGLVGLDFLDLAEVWKYRKDAKARGVAEADGPLRDLFKADPQAEPSLEKYKLFNSYKQDHVIRITCYGQTRFRHVRFDSTGKENSYGGGSHVALSEGPETAEVHIFTEEGLHLEFMVDFTFESKIDADQEKLAELARIRGPADVAVKERGLLAKPNPKRKNDDQFRARYAQTIAIALPKAARELVAYKGAKPEDVLPYLKEAVDLCRKSRELGPQAIFEVEEIAREFYPACFCSGLRDAYMLGLDLIAMIDNYLKRIDPASEKRHEKLAWFHGHGAHLNLANLAIVYRNDVDRSWMHREEWLRYAEAVGNPYNYQSSIVIDKEKARDSWPQRGWWRSEWDPYLPPAWEWPEEEKEGEKEKPEEEGQPDAQAAEGQELAEMISEAIKELDEARERDVRWLMGLSEELKKAEEKKAVARGTLAALRAAILECEERIQQLRQILKKDEAGDRDLYEFIVSSKDKLWQAIGLAGPPPSQPDTEMREVIEKKILDLQDQIAGLRRQQDETTEDSVKAYQTIIDELEAKGQRSQFDEVRDSVAPGRKSLQEFMKLAEVELYLASGEEGKFLQAARRCVDEGVYTAKVLLLQAIHFHSKGDFRKELHYLRKCVAEEEKAGAAGDEERRLASAGATRDPRGDASQPSEAQTMLTRLEVRYLRAIDAKSHDEATAVRRECWDRLSQHGDEGVFGAIWDVVNTGVTTSVMAIGGRNESLAEHAGTIDEEVGKQHGGLLLIAGLRLRGMTLSEIRRLTDEEFRATAKKLFNLSNDISPERARRMREAMMLTFRNPDVERLEKQSLFQLNADTGAAYDSTDDFLETSADWMGDASSAWNVFLWLGPSAVYRVGGKLATVGRWGAATKIDPGSILTAKQAFAEAIGLQKVVSGIAQNKYGAKIIQKFLEFHAGSSKLERFGVDALIQHYASEGAKLTARTAGALAGLSEKNQERAARAAELLAQALTSFGVGDYDIMASMAKKASLNAAQARLAAEGMKAAALEAAETRALTEKYMKVVDEVLPEVSQGRLPPASKQVVKTTLEDIRQEVLELGKRVVRGEAVAECAQRLDSLEAAFKALKAADDGLPTTSKAWRDMLGDIRDEIDGRLKNQTLRKQAVENLGQRLESAEAGSSQAGSPPPAGGGSAAKGGVDFQTAGATPSIDEKVLTGEFREAVNRYKRVLGLYNEFKLSNHPVVQGITQRLDEAIQASQAVRRLEILRRRPPANPQALKAVTAGDLEMMKGSYVLTPMAQAAKGANTSYWVIKVDKATGLAEKVGVFKELSPEAAATEVAVAEIHRAAGINVPACAKTTWQTPNGLRNGVFSRMIEGEELLSVLQSDPGMGQALKHELGRAQLLAQMCGDYDAHARNFKLDGSGRVWRIDFDLADPLEKRLPTGVDPSAMAAGVERAVSDRLDLVNGTDRPIYKAMRNVNDKIVWEKMEDALREFGSLKAQGLGDALKGCYTKDEIQRLFEIMDLRAKSLEKLGPQKLFAPLSTKLAPQAPAAPPTTSTSLQWRRRDGGGILRRACAEAPVEAAGSGGQIVERGARVLRLVA